MYFEFAKNSISVLKKDANHYKKFRENKLNFKNSKPNSHQSSVVIFDACKNNILKIKLRKGWQMNKKLSCIGYKSMLKACQRWFVWNEF